MADDLGGVVAPQHRPLLHLAADPAGDLAGGGACAPVEPPRPQHEARERRAQRNDQHQQHGDREHSRADEAADAGDLAPSGSATGRLRGRHAPAPPSSRGTGT